MHAIVKQQPKLFLLKFGTFYWCIIVWDDTSWTVINQRQARQNKNSQLLVGWWEISVLDRLDHIFLAVGEFGYQRVDFSLRVLCSLSVAVVAVSLTSSLHRSDQDSQLQYWFGIRTDLMRYWYWDVVTMFAVCCGKQHKCLTCHLLIYQQQILYHRPFHF